MSPSQEEEEEVEKVVTSPSQEVEYLTVNGMFQKVEY